MDGEECEGREIGSRNLSIDSCGIPVITTAHDKDRPTDGISVVHVKQIVMPYDMKTLGPHID